jgi:hypothetical protein
MGVKLDTNTIVTEKPRERLLGRRRHRQNDNIKLDFGEIGCQGVH